MQAKDKFDSKLARWTAHCSRFCAILKDKSINHLLSEDADWPDPIFFLNICRTPLYIGSIGSAEAERTFSCLRQIHSWLRTTMKDDRLHNLGVLAMQGFSSPLNAHKIYKEFVTKCNRRMCTTSVLYD